MILETVTRNAILDAIDDLINTGTGTATAKFETSADAALATVNLQNPALNAASAGTIGMAGLPLSSGSASAGTIAQLSIYNRNGTKVLELTAGTSGQEAVLPGLALIAGDTVRITSFSLTQPAS